MNRNQSKFEVQSLDEHSSHFGFYDQWAAMQVFDLLSDYDRLAIRRRAELIADVLNGNGLEKVLDIGCGEGIQLEVLAKKGYQNLTGMDLAVVRTQHARQRAPGSTCIAGSALELPFRDNYFDMVICSEVIEHLPDVNLALIEMKRIIRPGGRVILTTPYEEKIQYTVCVHCGQLTPNGGHLHSFNEAGLRDLNPGKF